MAKYSIKTSVPAELTEHAATVEQQVSDFANYFEPIEKTLWLIADARTGALYNECHVTGKVLIEQGTIDVPLDPDEQSEYRANRDLVEDSTAYEKMKEDALKNRSFSNLIAEFDGQSDASSRLKVIGGQHRFEAIKAALETGVNQYHGIKVYFALDTDQRLDVQLISNTNIAVSSDLLDRMYETVSGPQLRVWCQGVGLLDQKSDFADKRGKGRPLTVRAARTFIMNYLAGREVDPKKFAESKTTPKLANTGLDDPEWLAVKAGNPDLWKDKKLETAGKEFAELITSQRAYFEEGGNFDFREKATNFAVLSGWAYTAGLLSGNTTRLKRHYGLSETKGKDPLNAAMLAKGRHKTDPENYRGLGYRTDAKERGRFVELFYAHSEKGEGISKGLIDVAIARYHAKQAMLEAQQAEAKL